MGSAGDKDQQVTPVLATRPAQRASLAHHRRRPRTVVGALLATLVGAALAVGIVASPAAADPPSALSSQLTDTASVLGSQADAVRQAQSSLTSATSLRLYVVYVNSFDGTDPTSWATQTALATGLGTHDLLLAVAVTDHQYGLVASNSSPVSASEQSRIRTDVVVPQLKSSNWAGAAIDAAKALEQSGGSTGGSSGSGSGGGLLTIFLVGLVVIGGFLVYRSMRSKPAGPSTPGQPAPVDLTTLNSQASAGLVTLDDELRASEQDLGFAQAQFGLEATERFTGVLAGAKAAALQAFGLRQRLDDAVPETEPEQREMLTQILQLCTQADAALDEQTEAFNALRDLEARAPQVLEDTDRRAVEVSARIDPARQTLTQLAATYPAPSLASVSTNPDHAANLLGAAREAVQTGRAAITAEDRGAAVAAARTAESAVAHAVSLLDGVDRAGSELAGATAAIAARITSLGSDLSDVARLAPNDPTVGAAATTASAAWQAARAAGPGSDPLAILHDLGAAEAALDKALEPARGEAERADRARAQLAIAVGPLRSRIRAIGDFIETRRGAVGPEARTRLAEAARLLDEAESLMPTDAPRGLETVRRADQLAAQAQGLAQQDVEEFERSRSGRPGGFGGGSNHTGALILGGILINSLLRGGGGGGWGGGGGGFGGGGGGFGGGGGGF